jgi:hypothetical protein
MHDGNTTSLEKGLGRNVTGGEGDTSSNMIVCKDKKESRIKKTHKTAG